jgi:hypothetical protein
MSFDGMNRPCLPVQPSQEGASNIRIGLIIRRSTSAGSHSWQECFPPEDLNAWHDGKAGDYGVMGIALISIAFGLKVSLFGTGAL